MRDEATIANALELGLCRVIIGTRACNEPEWIESLISKFGSDRIVVGIDAKDGKVATKGWVEKTKVDALDFKEEALCIWIAMDYTHGCGHRWCHARAKFRGSRKNAGSRP